MKRSPEEQALGILRIEEFKSVYLVVLDAKRYGYTVDRLSWHGFYVSKLRSVCPVRWERKWRKDHAQNRVTFADLTPFAQKTIKAELSPVDATGKRKQYWHVLRANGTLDYNDERPVVLGEKMTVQGDIELCNYGLHASEKLFDALSYRSTGTICRVELGDVVIGGANKVVSRERTVIAWMPYTDYWQHLAQWMLHVIKELTPEYMPVDFPDPFANASDWFKAMLASGEVEPDRDLVPVINETSTTIYAFQSRSIGRFLAAYHNLLNDIVLKRECDGVIDYDGFCKEREKIGLFMLATLKMDFEKYMDAAVMATVPA